MSSKLRTALLHSVIAIVALAITAGVVAVVVWSDKAFKGKALEEQAQNVRDAEATILEAEERLAEGRPVEPVKGKLLGVDEALLSNDQMRRRLLSMGDIYLLQYKADADNPDRQLLYDLAMKSYERALEYCKRPGEAQERNEIMRRMADVYVGNGDYGKALNLLSGVKDLQMLPSDRWRFRMIEAECLLNSGKPWAAAAAFASVSDECEDKAMKADATVKRGKTLVDVASDAKLVKDYMSKDGAAPLQREPSPQELADERKLLLSSAMADFEKTLSISNSFDNAASEAKLGMLRIAVLNSDKTAAYDIVNAIQASPMSMRDKAQSLVVLATLHEKLGEYKTAIKLLETCSQSYPLTSMFVPVSLDLYGYYRKDNEWEKAFTVAERIIMRGPESAVIKKLIDDLSPERSSMLEMIKDSPDRDRYIDRLRDMLDKIKNSRPEAWKAIQHQANLILCKLLFISDKIPQAESAIAASLQAPMIPKPVEDELLYLDLECAVKSGVSPAVIVVRAKRYLKSFPVGRYYQEVLAAMLDAYYDMGLYEAALDVSRRMYMDDLMRRSTGGKPSKYWLKTVARIGECYAKLGNYDKANMILRDNAKALLNGQQSPYEAFKTWASIAESKGQIFEAMRRLDVVIPVLTDVDEKASLIVARYLLQLQVGNGKDFSAARALLAKIESSDKISKGTRVELVRELYKGLLGYAFRVDEEAVPGLLGEILSKFPDENWTQYWVLLSISKLYGKEALDKIGEKYDETLKSSSAFKGSKAEIDFIGRQLQLIRSLEKIEKDAAKLKSERNL